MSNFSNAGKDHTWCGRAQPGVPPADPEGGAVRRLDLLPRVGTGPGSRLDTQEATAQTLAPGCRPREPRRISSKSGAPVCGLGRRLFKFSVDSFQGVPLLLG